MVIHITISTQYIFMFHIFVIVNKYINSGIKFYESEC